jgi:hypothetical protein
MASIRPKKSPQGFGSKVSNRRQNTSKKRPSRLTHVGRAKTPKNICHQRNGEPWWYIPQKDGDPKKVSLLGRKILSSQGMTSVMTLHFFELSRHPLQG